MGFPLKSQKKKPPYLFRREELLEVVLLTAYTAAVYKKNNGAISRARGEACQCHFRSPLAYSVKTGRLRVQSF